MYEGPGAVSRSYLSVCTQAGSLLSTPWQTFEIAGYQKSKQCSVENF